MRAKISAGRGLPAFSFQRFLSGFLLCLVWSSLPAAGRAGEQVSGSERRAPGSVEKAGAETAAAGAWEFQDLQGGRHTLTEFRGRVVLLEFWASWCIPCRKGFPFLDAVQAKNAAADLQVVAVTLETEDDAVAEFVAGFPGVRFLVGRDPSGKGGEMFGVEAMPSAFLLDRDGKLLGRVEGGTEAAHRQIEAAVDAALRNAPNAGLAMAASGQDPVPRKGTVKAWERGYLADPIMSLDGDVLKRSLKEHIFASKEGAAGDGGVAGGGCGCN